MKKYFLITLFVSSFLSYKNDLNGHWLSKGLDNYEYKIDIENDSLCFMITSLDSEPSIGKHFENEKKVEIYDQSCGVYDFFMSLKMEVYTLKTSQEKRLNLKLTF